MPKMSDRESISAEEPMGPEVTRTDQPERSMPRVVGWSEGAVEDGMVEEEVEGAEAVVREEGACDQDVGPDMVMTGARLVRGALC